MSLAMGTASKAAHLRPATQATPYAASVSVIPPVPVSEKVEIEVRIAVRNFAAVAEQYQVCISVEPEKGVSSEVSNVQIQVQGNGQNSTKLKFPSARFVGKSQIRCVVASANGMKSEYEWPLTVIASDTRAVPLLQIGWIDPGAVPAGMVENDLRKIIDRYRDLGVRAFIITYPDYTYSGGGPYYPSQLLSEHPHQAPFDIVGTILNQASKNDQRVFVGIGWGKDLLLTWDGFDDEARKQAAFTHGIKTATELWTLYRREPSFYGWYLTHEANDIAQASRAYYDRMSDFLRTFEADKPVLISPAGTPIISEEILSKSKVDIFAYQDAVGAGYVPFKNTYDPDQRIKMLDDVYRKYAEAHRRSGKHLWANLEIWQMDGPEYKDAYPPNGDRVLRQLEIESRHVDVVTTYQLIGYMNPPGSATTDKRAFDLFESYRTYSDATARRLGIVRDNGRP
jgi:hypothetical protein